MASPWRSLCISGALRAISLDDDINLTKPIRSPPDEIPTKKAVAFAIVALSAIAIEILIRSLWVKRKGWSKKLKSDYPSIFEHIFDVPKIDDWVEESAFIKCDPTFYEEYLYYKYYNKVGKWGLEKKLIKQLPPELEKLADNSKRIYFTSRLAGLGK